MKVVVKYPDICQKCGSMLEWRMFTVDGLSGEQRLECPTVAACPRWKFLGFFWHDHPTEGSSYLTRPVIFLQEEI